MKKLFYIAIIAFIAVLGSCTSDSIDFSYTPKEPRCGQSITFSNTSTKGDSDSDWEWTFGDGSTSTIRSTTKTYKQAGVYMVTLTLDGKKYQRASKEITVYDSVPTFMVSTDSICTFKEITLTPLTYNPYGQSLTYQWQLPEDVVITDSTATYLKLYFTQAASEKTVTLITTLGNEVTTTTKTYTIHPTLASSLYIYDIEHNLLQQKLYEEAIEKPHTITLESILKLTTAKQLISSGDFLYLLNMSDNSDGAIYVLNLTDNSIQTVIRTANDISLRDSLYASAVLHNGDIYFTTKGNTAIYRISANTRNATFTDGTAQLFATADMLSGFTSGGNGIGVYGNIFYLGANDGIYRFRTTDINSGSAPELSLLNNQTPQNIQIDAMAGKIYSIEDGKLMVRNIDGSYPVEVDTDLSSTGALALSNNLNCIVYGTNSGVMSLPLIQTRNNTTNQTPVLLNDVVATSLVIDESLR